MIRKDKSECAPCKLSEWTEWSGCELGADPFAGAFSHRERTFGPREGFHKSECESDVQYVSDAVFNSAYEGKYFFECFGNFS